RASSGAQRRWGTGRQTKGREAVYRTEAAGGPDAWKSREKPIMKNPNEIYATANLTNPNGAEPSELCRYDVEIDLNSNSTHATVVRLIGTGKRVLELGCAVGHMSRVLRDRGCEIVAIEMDAQAADRATVVCERVVVADLDHMNFERELGSDQFDVVVA